MLLRRIERFLKRTGMSRSRFGRLAVNDPRFVFDLHNGRTPRPNAEARVEHFMNTHQENDHAH